jgi:hypothetical protein
MVTRLGLIGLWLAFAGYAFFLAPPDDPQKTLELITRLIRWDVAGINPLIVAEFNLMGILPLGYWCLLLIDGHRQKSLGQKISAWPFALLMMAVGAFALLPYLALRRPLQGDEPIPTPLGWSLHLWNSVWTGRILSLGVIGLLGYGILNGDWLGFVAAWQTNRFIHVMTLDFLLLYSLFPWVIAEDRIGRHETSGWPSWAVSWIPLLGAFGYLSFRPEIQPSSSDGAA